MTDGGSLMMINKKEMGKVKQIEGRTNSTYDVLESYLYYMVKPENIDRIRLKALKALEQIGRR